MRFLILSLVALSAAGCTRPSAGMSFHELVWAASDGLREYESWVAADDDGFPNELCLAGIHFSASLAETRSQSGSIGLPLAAPAMGLTGMLGYQFISTQSETGTISASLEARYQEKAVPADQKRRDAFIANIPQRRAQQNSQAKPWKIKEPPKLPDYAHRDRPPFAQRDDLAAELWRIRQALHSAVLNSPEDIVLRPGPLTLHVGYVATVSTGGEVTIRLGGKPLASAGPTGGATEENKMVLIFQHNVSKEDTFNCHKGSIDKDAFKKLIEKLDTKVSAAKAPPPPQS